ncbi:sucrose phosphorylase [Celeribacter neptunius]|uniref:Sucrose phosphorylase n=1 Tax=Celeribacter neptunius TaxID=588602 RepID=A0A1I3IQL2_9RHOB|nr:sucrose phosphorylase [Celeribacter neptunius]SFI50256.1 sucrose phosphorylase [Celeribacter neptunius]
MKNKVQLITYVDRLTGGGFNALKAMLEGPMQGLFGTVHALPFFPPIDGADAGFDAIDHTTVDRRLGDWADVKTLSTGTDVMADMIVNHISAQSAPFQDFLEKGAASEFAEMFLTYGKVFPEGATEADLMAIYRPRPGFPFTKMRFGDGTQHLVWTSFTEMQIDIDVKSTQGAAYLDRIFDAFKAGGVSSIRLDAAGYAIKKPGTSCFMIPETYEFLGELAQKAKARDMDVLVEIHSYYQDQIDIAKRVDRVYDFALPPLVLHALYTGDAAPLANWLEISPRNAITVLDTHDGIGVIDAGAATDGRPGLLTPSQIDNLVETMHEKSGGTSREATGAKASNMDLYQVNSTYFDVLGQNEAAYLIARAVQFFVPGIPQVYYVGLLGGTNDMELLRRTDVGRDINRHYYGAGEVEAALATPMVAELCDLIRFRNTHPAFEGEFTLNVLSSSVLELVWENGEARAVLSVDFATKAATVRHAAGTGTEERFVIGG